MHLKFFFANLQSKNISQPNDRNLVGGFRTEKKSSDFFESRCATIQHFLNSLKSGTNVYEMISTSEKCLNKNLKVAFFLNSIKFAFGLF